MMVVYQSCKKTTNKQLLLQNLKFKKHQIMPQIMSLIVKILLRMMKMSKMNVSTMKKTELQISFQMMYQSGQRSLTICINTGNSCGQQNVKIGIPHFLNQRENLKNRHEQKQDLLMDHFLKENC